MFNAQGDVVGIIDQNGTQVVSYDYSAWGELISITGTMADTLGQQNPIRYRGYYYDNESGFYYLQSRYYDPVTHRFINADGLVSTGQGVLGNNMFAYCENSPVLFNDPSGTWKQVNGGWQAQRGDTLWGLAVQLYGNGTKWTTFGFGRDPKTLRIGEVINTASGNGGSYASGGALLKFRDVTYEVNSALSTYIRMAEEIALLANNIPIYESYRYGAFALLVNHGAAWDIKRKGPWEATIGTPFPGYGALVLFQGNIMTPENLGNYTYGFLGAAFGISYQTLIKGSVFAAFSGGSMGVSGGMTNEIGDWNYILYGYSMYYLYAW